jgi:hypothetical protein
MKPPVKRIIARILDPWYLVTVLIIDLISDLVFFHGSEPVFLALLVSSLLWGVFFGICAEVYRWTRR